jgi:nucleotide-binding universal stress UspA family protein
MTTTAERATGSVRTIDPGAVFRRVIAGVDGSEAGLEACRQAARLLAPEGELELCSAVYLVEAYLAAWSASQIKKELQREKGAALEEAARLVGRPVATWLVSRPPQEALLDEVRRTRAGLLVVGSHNRSRLSEILIGGVAGEMLHDAPCSVLVARPPGTGDLFPLKIAVGIDGSARSDGALAVAQHLARRFDADVRTLTATRGKGVDLARAHLRTPFVETVDAAPVDALVAAARGADLVIVGSRGLHGLAVLGSVSERVAHQAPCSVLVVRDAALDAPPAEGPSLFGGGFAP